MRVGVRCEGGISGCVREKVLLALRMSFVGCVRMGFMYVGCVRMGSCM